MTKKARIQAEYFLHQIHWNNAQSLLATRDKGGSDEGALETTALLLVSFASEALANRLLEIGCPVEYADERKFFRDAPYQGTPGKLRFLADKLQVPIDPGARPFQSLRTLFTWRDKMVHARVERFDEVVAFIDPSKVEAPESELLNFAPIHGAQLMADVEQLANLIQGAALSARWPKIYGPQAFNHITSTRGIDLSGRS